MDGDTPEDVSDTIRYQGKAVDDPAWIPAFLTDREVGVLGLVDGDAPHLVTTLFVYDDDSGSIFVHGAQDGRAHGIVEGEGDGGARASFTTSERGRYVPADEPVNFTVEYASVVADGTVSLVSDPEEKRRVLERFMAKFAPHLTPGEDYERIAEESVGRTAVYRLDVESWSGKRGWKDDDEPGAYTLDSVRDAV